MTTRPYGMPKYQHAAAVLRAEVQSGVYAAGESLPSETKLVERFNYDRSTIRKALAQLRQEGLVISEQGRDRKSTRLNSSHVAISYAVFCLKKKNHTNNAKR